MAAGVADRRARSRGARAAASAAFARLTIARPRPIARALIVALPAVLLAYLSFASGGFFPLTTALVGLLVGLMLVVRVTVGSDPFEGFGAALAVSLGAFGLLGAWMLASMLWDASALRAILEFDRLLLYLLGAALVGSVAWRARERRWMVSLTVASLFGVCVLSLASRLVPSLWTVGEDFAAEPLNYPLGYSNALGIFAGLGVVLAFHLTTDERGPRLVRVLAALAVPALAATVLLTFSRGAIVATALALVAYLVLGRPRGLLAGALASAPPAAYALSRVYEADLVASALPSAPAALAQARGLAVAILGACLVAAALRALGLVLDSWMARIRVGRTTRRVAAATLFAAPLVAALVVALSFDVPRVVASQYERVTGVDPGYGATRDRLTAPGASGRFQEWAVAWERFEEEPLTGGGAGTYQALWAERRPVDRELRDAHSLYFEVASELGAVGLALTVAAIGAILVGLLARCRGPERALHAALASAWLGWAVHAGIDWDWEVPALTMPFLLLAVAGLTARTKDPGRTPEPGRRSGSPTRLTRVLVGVGLLVLLVTPALVAVSQVRLESSLRAWKQGDCSRTIDDALGSLDALPVRTEPFELVAYCDARFGLNDLADDAMRSAIARDPRSWDLWYGLAMVHGAAGRDPRPAMAEAVRLNPLEPMTIEGARLFRTDDPEEWERRALSARLPIP